MSSVKMDIIKNPPHYNPHILLTYRQHGEKEFIMEIKKMHIDENEIEFVNTSRSTRNGFAHDTTLFINGRQYMTSVSQLTSVLSFTRKY